MVWSSTDLEGPGRVQQADGAKVEHDEPTRWGPGHLGVSEAGESRDPGLEEEAASRQNFHPEHGDLDAAGTIRLSRGAGEVPEKQPGQGEVRRETASRRRDRVV